MRFIFFFTKKLTLLRKIDFMDRQLFLTLTSSSQWLLFLAIGLIIFSWIEKKQVIRQSGQLAFGILGVFALWVVLSGKVVVPETLPGASVPVEARAMIYFSGLVLTGALGLFAFLLGRTGISLGKYLNMLLVAIGLALFFMVNHLQRL